MFRFEGQAMKKREKDWQSASFAMLLMNEADGFARDENDAATSYEWRRVAARVACLERLGVETPTGVRRWVKEATAYLDREDRFADSDDVLFSGEERVYAAFRQAFSRANPELQQRLAAAQDVFRGGDYYACEEY